MLSSKEIYMDEHIRLTALAEDAGMDWDEAYDSTADAAWDAMRDRVADMADEVRIGAVERFINDFGKGE